MYKEINKELTLQQVRLQATEVIAFKELFSNLAKATAITEEIIDTIAKLTAIAETNDEA